MTTSGEVCPDAKPSPSWGQNCPSRHSPAPDRNDRRGRFLYHPGNPPSLRVGRLSSSRRCVPRLGVLGHAWEVLEQTQHTGEYHHYVDNHYTIPYFLRFSRRRSLCRTVSHTTRSSEFGLIARMSTLMTWLSLTRRSWDANQTASWLMSFRSTSSR